MRWAEVDLSTVQDTKAYLAQLVTRQSLNTVRAASRRREEYVGPWLPEPLLLADKDASSDVVLAESVSMAMMVVLETLSPDERAVFVLREVFGFDYDEIGSAVGKSAAAARQSAHRAREHVQARRKRFESVDPKQSMQSPRNSSRPQPPAIWTDWCRCWRRMWCGPPTAMARSARRDDRSRVRTTSPSSSWVCSDWADRTARRAGDLQQRPGAGALPRRSPRGRDQRRGDRRQDHQLLRDAQSGEARDGDRPPPDQPLKIPPKWTSLSPSARFHRRGFCFGAYSVGSRHAPGCPQPSRRSDILMPCVSTDWERSAVPPRCCAPSPRRPPDLRCRHPPR